MQAIHLSITFKQKTKYGSYKKLQWLNQYTLEKKKQFNAKGLQTEQNNIKRKMRRQ